MPHISLVSHEPLRIRADLREEVEDMRNCLGAIPPASHCRYVMLYRFAHNTWAGSWWRHALGPHARSWRLLARP